MSLCGTGQQHKKKDVEGFPMSLRTMASKGLVLSVALTMLAGVELGAQSPKAIREGDLATIKTLKCAFPSATAVTWNKGVPEPRVSTRTVLNLDIEQIDAVDGTAVIVTAAGLSSEVTAQMYGWNMHFLELSQNGRMRLTTVFAQYATGERLKAVHTRTDYLPINLPGVNSQPDLVQSYGSCEVGR